MRQILSLGELLRKARTDKKFLLREVSALTEIDSAILSKIERGERFPTNDQANRLCKILNLDSKDILLELASEKILKEVGFQKDSMKIIENVKRKINLGRK